MNDSVDSDGVCTGGSGGDWGPWRERKEKWVWERGRREVVIVGGLNTVVVVIFKVVDGGATKLPLIFLKWTKLSQNSKLIKKKNVILKW